MRADLLWTPIEVLEKLLALGPLTQEDLVDITGWEPGRLWLALRGATSRRGRIRRDRIGSTWLYRLLAEGEQGRNAPGPAPGRPQTVERWEAHKQRVRDRGELHRMRSREQRGRAPARVEPLQPGLHGVWGPHGLLHPADEGAVEGAARPAHGQGGGGLGGLGARRDGAARALRADLERVGGLGQ